MAKELRSSEKLSSPMSKCQRSVLITGCSSGIGHALAREFHARSLQVFSTARSANRIQDLADLGMTTFELDVTNYDTVLRVRDQVAEITGGKLDILVNNAGQNILGAASDVDMDKVEAMFNANLFGVMRMVKAFVPLLIASGDARILQIGSITGVVSPPFSSAYNASKAALHSYGDTLRVELAPFGIKVINVCTGGVTSNIHGSHATSFCPDGSIYKPVENIVLERRVGYALKDAMPTESYAKHVVGLTLKKNPPPWIWSGTLVGMFWFLKTFLWRSAFDWIVSRMFGLSILAQLLNKGKVKATM